MNSDLKGGCDLCHDAWVEPNEYVALCHMKRLIHDRKHEAWRPAYTVKLVIVIEQMYQKRSSPESV